MYFACAAVFLLSSTSSLAAGQHGSRHAVRAATAVSSDVRAAARKLAHAWVDTASAGTLDQLADRSIAFAGMVRGVFVLVDGKRVSAERVLTDSSLVILGKETTSADAEAMRNTVYTLMQIADGRAGRSGRYLR